jgi:hypothetical protein
MRRDLDLGDTACGEIRTVQSFLQGFVGAIAGYYINSPHTGQVVCVGGRSD